MNLKMTPFFLNLAIKRSLFLLILLSITVTSFSQKNILDKKINIPEFNGSAKELIQWIGDNDSIVFAYSSEVDLSYHIDFQKQQIGLKEFLKILLKGKSVSYKISGNKVLLFNEKKSGNQSGSLKQTIRGTIVDEDSRMPLIGATVSIPGTNPIIGTITDGDGRFRLENIPVGRISLQLSYIGYEAIRLPNIEVNSGKEVILNLTMHESATKLDEVVVTDRKRGEAINDLSLLSSRSISVEETKRYTGGMDDPARMVTSYAGVTSTGAGSNSDIIVRGNSPKYMQWRLDGVEISSPYHMDDQNASYGALTALNKYLLTSSDFYTGAFSPEYGNVLSNVMDMKLRRGNNENFEATVGVGLMGVDLTLEGPFKKGYAGSYLINYRYSAISLLDKLGLLEGVEGIVNYQDATFKAVLPTKKTGTFSLFGLAGLSGISIENVEPDGVTTPGMSTDASIIKDYDKTANLLNFGIIHTLPISTSSYIKTSLSYSGNGYNDDLYQKEKLTNSDGEIINDSDSDRLQTFKSRIINSAYRANLTYNKRINAKNKIQIGTKYCINFSNYNQDVFDDDANDLVNVTDFNNSVNSISNFVSWKYMLNDNITFVSGLHNMNVLLNKKSTLEPRIAVNWTVNSSNSFHIGYGKHSTTESVHNYFTKIQQADGSYTEPNKDLGLLKADHFVLGYNTFFSEYLSGKIEIYYQHLYDLPVEDNDTSYYCTINEGTDYQYVALVNEGVGKNYGVEITMERFFDNNYYFVWNASLYESKYKTLEGVWRNTKYNGNYIVNFLWGKEFKNLGKKDNKTLAINCKAYVGGAQRYIPLLRDEDGNVAVDTENNLYWDYEKAYDNKLEHLYNLNLSISYKINKAKSTHEIYLDLMNIVHSNAHLSEYYDESEPGNVGYIKQMTFFPNMMYRVYF